MEDTHFEEQMQAWSDSKLGYTLTALRKRNGMTQEELSARVGMRRQVLRRIERSPGATSLMTLNKITRELGEPLWKVLKYADKREN